MCLAFVVWLPFLEFYRMELVNMCTQIAIRAKVSPATSSGSESLIFRPFPLSQLFLNIYPMFFLPSPRGDCARLSGSACMTHWRADRSAQLQRQVASGNTTNSCSSCLQQFSLFKSCSMTTFYPLEIK